MGTNSATTNAPSTLQKITDNPHLTSLWQSASPLERIAIIVLIAFLAHVLVKLVRHISEWSINRSHAQKHRLSFMTEQPKFITLMRLIVSAVTFVIYFLAIGFILVQEFHFDLTTYLASASIIGLAISFGSQSLVQDVVTGVTLIFSDAMDVGDIVDLSGTIGRVEQIGLRFTRLTNFYNQEIFIPNRNILNVARFPHGGVHAYADVQVPADADVAKISKMVEDIAKGTWMEFGGIILEEPQLEKVATLSRGGWNFLRVQFKVWPGQGGLIETTFRQKIVVAMKTFAADYSDSMVTVTYRAIKVV